MLRAVEDILDSWENTGLIQDYPDRFNLAVILETQQRVNDKYANPKRFAYLSFTSLVKLCQQNQDLFQGLIDSIDCNDVYKLGPVPNGDDADICTQLVLRISQLNLKSSYFGGLIVQNGCVYLLTEPMK